MLKQTVDLFDFLDQHGPDLDSFRKCPPLVLFPKATQLPEFFKFNLVSPQREVLQIQNNLNGRLKVFYYQLFKVCFELQISKSSIILSHLQQMVFRNPDGNAGNSMLNTKKIIAQWLLKLMHQQCADCLASVCSYPILDDIFCAFLTEMLARKRQCEPSQLPIHEVFGQLADEFQLSVLTYGNCFRFEDSDVFCYFQDEWLYLAYMNSSFMEGSTDKFPVLDVIVERENSESGTKHNLSTSKSKIFSITNFNVQKPTHRRTTSIELSCQQQVPTNEPFNVQISDFQMPASGDRSFQSLKQQLQDRMTSTKANTLRSTLTEVKDEIQQPLELSKGDFYEDFTSTFILQALGEPFRSSIRGIKNSMRGMRKGIKPAVIRY